MKQVDSFAVRCTSREGREREGERETGGIHSDSQMGILVVLSTTDYYNKRERERDKERKREREIY